MYGIVFIRCYYIIYNTMINFSELLDHSVDNISIKCGWDVEFIKHNSEYITGLVYSNEPTCHKVPYNIIWNKYGISIDIEQKPWHHYFGLIYND